ncbi:MAG: restriction endonuclease subunit S [Mycoplasma sp.]
MDKKKDLVYKKLNEIGFTLAGLTGKNKKDFSTDANSYFIPYNNVFKNIYIDENYLSKVKVSVDEKQNQVQYNDILITNSSETLEEVAYCSNVNFKKDFPIYLNSFCFIYRVNNQEEVNPKFLNYLFKSDLYRNKIMGCSNGVTRYNLSKKLFLDLQIPLPPLDIQNQIVGILDQLSSYTAELSAELSAELDARSSQYKYCSQNLLDLNKENHLLGKFTIEYKTIGDLCDIKRGDVISKKYIVANPGEYPVYSSATFNDGCIGKINSYMYDGEYVTYTTHGFYAGTVFYRNEKFNITQNCGLLVNKDNNKVNTKFLFYICSFIIKEHVNPGMGIAVLNSSVVEKIKIPVPPLNIQNKIVEMLDQFDTMIKNIENGLPRLIELNEKRYKYYLNKLLTFGGQYE